ncbi:MAG TPA: tetratricopeptide repeat protein [Candidatus Limnocylindrales bacterium]|nr:tetratricopeptide repeat protein [Candidatus Limnocylindrales bacterium]
MIEVLLEAERALTHGRIDEADRLYRQVAERDPKSAIAVVGLARVALERGDDLAAYLHGRRALAIDPENPTARHLVMRMGEVLAGRGEAPGDAGQALPPVPAPSAAPSDPAAPAREPGPGAASDQRPAASAPHPDAGRRKPDIVSRLLRRTRR